MKLDNVSLGFITDLFKEKMIATEKKDELAIKALKEKYPELFSADFMVDFLRNFFENKDKISLKEIPFVRYITKLH